MGRRIVVSLVVVMACVGWGWICYQLFCQTTAKAAMTESLLRLHVIASGDSAREQAVKLMVRDAVLAKLSDELMRAERVEDACSIVKRREDEIIMTAKQVLDAAGDDSSVRMEVGRFDFPVRMYGDILVPAGEYEAVRIILGEGKGKNWWCVLFPPLCTLDVSVAVGSEAEVEAKRVIYRSKLAEILSDSK